MTKLDRLLTWFAQTAYNTNDSICIQGPPEEPVFELRSILQKDEEHEDVPTQVFDRAAIVHVKTVTEDHDTELMTKPPV